MKTPIIDPNYFSWETAGLTEYDWTGFYKEAIPPNAPIPRRHPIQMNALVDADHQAIISPSDLTLG